VISEGSDIARLRSCVGREAVIAGVKPAIQAVPQKATDRKRQWISTSSEKINSNECSSVE
jgi:hypothetical protein